ncbi:MAG: hypothetical protein RMK32_07130 [Anaerolineae bacterium]|nr:hypothetical protein [Thermoflexus sp.]MDW8065386.1 hypothetical protein [Anaerolineae bacterium]
MAIAFARSPAVIAYTLGSDLAILSHMILGLRTQEEAYVERRFGMP